MVIVAKENMDEYLTISPDIAQTAIELMKFYVDTKKLLYGFPLNTIPPSHEINVGPSVSQLIHPIEQNMRDNNLSTTGNTDNTSVVSAHSGFSTLSSSICPFDGSTVDATINKILLHKYRTISSARLAQILRVRDNLLRISKWPFSRLLCSFHKASWSECRKYKKVYIFG
jgi:hypothetical protein